MTLAFRLATCRLCATALNLQTSKGATDYRPRELISISVGRYIGGTGKARERFKFLGEVCAGCAADIDRLLEPLIAYIDEREIGR